MTPAAETLTASLFGQPVGKTSENLSTTTLHRSEIAETDETGIIGSLHSLLDIHSVLVIEEHLKC
jgi:hypothetical protein